MAALAGRQHAVLTTAELVGCGLILVSNPARTIKDLRSVLDCDSWEEAIRQLRDDPAGVAATLRGLLARRAAA